MTKPSSALAPFKYLAVIAPIAALAIFLVGMGIGDHRSTDTIPPVGGDADRRLSTRAWANSQRFDPAKVAEAKRALLAEPKVKDLLFQDGRYDVEWQVGVVPDGTPRYGYAGSLCLLLSDFGLVDDDVSVRVVDIYAVERGADFRTASLGHVRCHDGQNLGV